MIAIKPAGDRLLIETVDVKVTTKSGLYVPESIRDERRGARGVVAAVGPGKTLDSGVKLEIPYKVGDCILYTKNTGTPVKIDEKDYLIIKEHDIIATVVNEEAEVQ